MAQRDLVVRFLGDSKGLQRAAKDAISSLDGTENKAQAVAKALVRMSEQSEAEMRDAASAADALGAAIGDELRAEVESAGGSIDQYVADLKRAGLTYDEIRQEADALGDALVRMSTQGKAAGNDIKAGADEAQAGLEKVRTEGDNSRSVLANMVGNSTQDLGELGGIAGTAGVAIGQLAEYATEGNISLKGLASVAGPMLGVSAAVLAVTAVLKELGERSKRVKEQTEALVKVQEDLADGRFAEAAASLAEEYIGTVGAAEEFGFTVDDVVRQLTSQADMMPRLNTLIAEYEQKARSGDEADIARLDTLYRLQENLGIATEAYGAAGDKIASTNEVADKLEGALRANAAAADGTAESFSGVDRAARDFADEIERAEAETRQLDSAYRRLMGNLDDRDAWRAVEDALADLSEKINSGEASWAELGEATDDALKAMAEYIIGLEELPKEVSIDLLTKLDEGDLDRVKEVLLGLRAGVEVPVRFQPINSTAIQRRASGGPVRAGEPYLVGEEGPELVVPSQSGTVLDAGRTREALMPVSGSGVGVSASGSRPSVMNITIQTGADPQAVVAAVERYRRQNGGLPW